MGHFKGRRGRSGNRNKDGPKKGIPPENSPVELKKKEEEKKEEMESVVQEEKIPEKTPETPPAVTTYPLDVLEDISERSEVEKPEDPVIQEEEKKGEEPEESADGKEEKVEEKPKEVEKIEEIPMKEGDLEDISDESEMESEATYPPEPEVFTNYDWEKKDEDVNVKQAIFVQTYHRKFAVVLQVINPEFRFAAEIGPCETFDEDGVQKILEKFKNIGFEKPWPFEEGFKATSEELRQFLHEVLNQTKFVLRLACAERGYEYMNGKQQIQPISAVWGEEIEPILELKTIKSMMELAKSVISGQLEGVESRFWSELWLIFDVILPALETFDSKTLHQNSITDTMATIHGRVELGFEITEEEVDQMLVKSFEEDGFGEFPPTALYAPTVFKTVKQLKLIHEQLDKMSKVTDIRVKLAGIQTITRILELIGEEETMNLMEELKDHPKVSIEKMFGFVPANFEVAGREPKRTQYLKIFYTALGESSPKEEFFFAYPKLVAIFKCFYLVFSAFEINTIIFKILGCHWKENAQFDRDRRMILNALYMLPDPLKHRLEIGKAYEIGEVTEDQDSMYFQVKHIIRNGNQGSNQIQMLLNVLCLHVSHRSNSEPLPQIIYLISAEKSLRVAMNCIETGSNQQMAVEMLRILSRPPIMDLSFSKTFFEDLIVLALSKYSVPEETTSNRKYEFIKLVFDMLTTYKEARGLSIDEPRLIEKWTNLGHPWFSVLYLSHRFELLQFSVPVAQYPWKSADLWTDERKDQTADLKNYVPLAKVPTAWPNCTELNVIEALVSEHVPQTISRHELYKAMKEYVADFNINETWKADLLRAFSKKITFLTPNRDRKRAKSEKREERKSRDKEGKGKKKEEKVEEEEDLKKGEDPKKGEEKEEIQKEEDSKVEVEEDKKEDSKDAGEEKDPGEEKDSKKEEIQNSEEDKKKDPKEEIQKPEDVEKKDSVEEEKPEDVKEILEIQKTKEEEDPSESENKEDPEDSEIQKTVEEDQKTQETPESTPESKNPSESTQKSLKSLAPDCFYSFYPEEKWMGLPEKVREEIKRQRVRDGYSNQLE